MDLPKTLRHAAELLERSRTAPPGERERLIVEAKGIIANVHAGMLATDDPCMHVVHPAAAIRRARRYSLAGS